MRINALAESGEADGNGAAVTAIDGTGDYEQTKRKSRPSQGSFARESAPKLTGKSEPEKARAAITLATSRTIS